jgi:hypothetical protein
LLTSAVAVIYLPSDIGSVKPMWTLGDGTVCVLAECDQAPRFAISLVRNAQILRQRRVYAEASARVLAENWRVAIGGVQNGPRD